MTENNKFEINSDDTDLENLLNRGAIHQIVKDAVAKLPPNVTEIRASIDGEHNSGFCKYIDIEGKTHRLLIYSSEMKAFFKTLRDRFKGSAITGFHLESAEHKTALTWAIRGDITLVGELPDD